MIEYVYSAEGIRASQLHGFFAGWPNPPSAEVHLKLLQQSDEIVLALDTASGMVVGFVTAITDRVLTAYIPLLEVLPDYQHQQIGKTLVEKILGQLNRYYMIDLLCDKDLQSFYEQFGMRAATGMFFRNYDKQAARAVDLLDGKTRMIREINEHDAMEMAELIKQLGSSTADINRDTIKSKILAMMHLDHIKIFGYEQDGKIVGTCTLARVEGLSHGCRPFAVIENVVVWDSSRSNGIGRQLIRHAIDQAQAWDCYKVILETGTKNEWKLKFYESCGLARGGKTAFIKRF